MESAGMGPAKLLLPFHVPQAKISLSPSWKRTGNAPLLCFRNGIPQFNTATKITLCCSLSPPIGGTKGKDHGL